MALTEICWARSSRFSGRRNRGTQIRNNASNTPIAISKGSIWPVDLDPLSAISFALVPPSLARVLFVGILSRGRFGHRGIGRVGEKGSLPQANLKKSGAQPCLGPPCDE